MVVVIVGVDDMIQFFFHGGLCGCIGQERRGRLEYTKSSSLWWLS